MITLLLLLQDPFPVKEGHRWTFVSGDKEMVLKVGKQVEIKAWSGTVKAWVLEGLEKDPVWLEPIADGMRIHAMRPVGEGAVDMIVPIAELRWGKEKEWKFRTIYG
jgi:hypothetical protein